MGEGEEKGGVEGENDTISSVYIKIVRMGDERDKAETYTLQMLS